MRGKARGTNTVGQVPLEIGELAAGFRNRMFEPTICVIVEILDV
jgi:hypothetical protein